MRVSSRGARGDHGARCAPAGVRVLRRSRAVRTFGRHTGRSHGPGGPCSLGRLRMTLTGAVRLVTGVAARSPADPVAGAAREAAERKVR
jgi:hypothetical protein